MDVMAKTKIQSSGFEPGTFKFVSIHLHQFMVVMMTVMMLLLMMMIIIIIIIIVIGTRLKAKGKATPVTGSEGP
jgi:type IV secretory pathway TrbL component